MLLSCFSIVLTLKVMTLMLSMKFNALNLQGLVPTCKVEEHSGQGEAANAFAQREHCF